jgi:PAS domain-containing protein
MDENKQVRELPPAVRSLIEARTGDAVYVVDPDYKIVHWDSQMESLTGALSQEAWGRLVTKPSWVSARTGDLSAPTAAR